jgi:quinol monooxygenase YgiN
MIIVWGSVKAKPQYREEALRISLEHVARSRAEPGCISHNVSLDAEDNKRLNFFEEWDDIDALHRHFKVKGAIAFAARLGEVAVNPPELKIFDASRIR